jgi:hypothetical protein
MSIIRGVYFLSNDKMLELTTAFLNSFRRFNPDIPMCLIPYNSDYKKTAEIGDIYNFSVLTDNKILDACDKLSFSFYGHISGSFRKLAIWEGPFDEFVYIDTDTVVLNNIEFSFKLLSDYDFITSHAFLPSIRKFVWKESIYEANVLSEEQISYSANTGYIISNKKALSLDTAGKKLDAALEIKDHMELFCGEQPFLNYLFVTSGKYTSLLTLYNMKYDQKLPLEIWAGIKFGVVSRGKISFRFANYQILLVHWAGIYRLNDFEKWFYDKVYKLFNIKKEIPKVSFFMPYKRLWNYYRYLKK